MTQIVDQAATKIPGQTYAVTMAYAYYHAKKVCARDLKGTFATTVLQSLNAYDRHSAMHYLGGKTAIAKQIAVVLEKYRPGTESRFIDVFCGGLSVTSEMSGPRWANDACTPLIALYQAWQSGWRPPDTPIDECMYEQMRYDPNKDLTDPFTAFIGFGMSYAGKWFDTYARSSRGNRSDPYFYYRAKRSLAAKMHLCQNVEFSCFDFRDVQVREGDLVYCDPPYRTGVRSESGAGYEFFGSDFDHDSFDRYIHQWARIGATVIVSEYIAPPGTFEIAKWDVHKSPLSGHQTERLFIVC